MSFFKTTMTLAAASLPSLVPSFTPTQVTQLCSLNPQTVLPGIPTLLYSFDFDASSKSELAKPQVSFAQPKWVHSIQPNVCNPGRRPRDSFCLGQVKILAILTRSLITTRGFRSWKPASYRDPGPDYQEPAPASTAQHQARDPASHAASGAGRGARRLVGPQWAGAVECPCAGAWLGKASVHLGKEVGSRWQWREPSLGEGESRGPVRASRSPKSLLRLRGPCSSAIPRRRAPSRVYTGIWKIHWDV